MGTLNFTLWFPWNYGLKVEASQISSFCSQTWWSLAGFVATFNWFVFSPSSEEKTEQLLDSKQELEQMEAELKRLQQEVWV